MKRSSGTRAHFAPHNEFAPHPQYRSVNGRAHRKAPARIGPPALTRHRAFWIPPATDEDTTFEERRNRWIQHIDCFLASFLVNAFNEWRKEEIKTHRFDSAGRRKISTEFMPRSFNAKKIHADRNNHDYDFELFHHVVECRVQDIDDPGVMTIRKRKAEYEGRDGPSDGRRPPNDTRFETVSYRFFFDRVPITMRAELQSEYFTISLAASFDLPSKKHVPRSNTKLCRTIAKYFRTVEGVMVNRWTRAQRGGSKRNRAEILKALQDEKVLVSDATTFLFAQFWSELEAAFFAPSFGWPPGELITPPGFEVGKLAENVGRCFVDFRGMLLSMLQTPSEDRLIDMPFTVPESVAMRDYVSQKGLKPKEEFDLVDSLLPIIDGARDAVGPEYMHQNFETFYGQHDVEYAAGSVHRNRAIYLSALSPQPAWGRHRDPLCYIVITKHRHRWQLGRLIDRLQTAGTFRVASLIDYAELNAAGFKLRQLEWDLDDVDRKFSKDAIAGDTLSEREQHRRDKARDRAKRIQLQGFSSDYNDIAFEGGEGGLQYRTERSQFYVQQFKKEIAAIGFERIEGLQPYKAFVQRKLGPTWDYIASLGARFERIGRRLDLFGNQIRADYAISQVTGLRDLQEFAEEVAILPIAYYGGHFLEALLGVLTVFHWPWFEELLQHRGDEPSPMLGLCMIAAALVYLPVRKRWRKQRRREEHASVTGKG